MQDFNGTIRVKSNPVTATEAYSHTFERSVDEKSPGYSDIQFSLRAEGGYHRAKFTVRDTSTFMSEFLKSAGGREVVVHSNDGEVLWEGYIHQIEYDAGNVSYKIDIGEMYNATWVRYRVRGTSTTVRSTVQTEDDSISRYGRKEFVMSGGELENSGIADAVAQQFLDLHGWPRPTPVQIDPEGEFAEYPTIRVDCRGWFETLGWCTYNQTASTDSQGASAQVIDIVSDTDVGQFVQFLEVQTNATSVSKEYDADRRGGDIVRDIARLGDASNNRWIAYMDMDRTFKFEPAKPPVRE